MVDKVVITKSKLDNLARAVSNKSGAALNLTIDQMVTAVNSITTGGGGIIPTGTIQITSNGTVNVTSYASAEVNVPTGSTINNQDKTVTPSTSQQTITADSGYTGLGTVTVNAMSSLTLPTSTAASATSGYTKKATVSRSTSTQYINIGTGYNAASGYYEISAVANGTVGTPTATKGTVSNNSISVTPSVTNTTGYISGGTINGTAVTVSASELVSGSQTITSNQTVDVTNLAELVVNVGGGTPMQIETNIVASSYTSSTVTFTGLKGEPKVFWAIHGAAIATGTPSKVASIVFDGTSMHGQIVTNASNAQASYSTSFSYTYSNGTLTITSSNATFISANYILTYAYGGGVVDTKDVQVGSGATSITFTGLEAEPTLWSCIFKSNFSTSSGYQRVMYVEHEDDFTIGFYMDSSANPNPTYWSYSYNNGSLTITSQGTNAGGYFHQPGYYQLTYAYDDGSSGNYQSKTVTPTTSQQVVEADSGYDALKRVTVNAMPSGSAIAPSTISGTAASVSTGTNTLTLTKTVSVTPTVSAGYVSAGTAGNSSVSLTASVTTKAAATITPTTTNQTIAAGTYITGTQTIAGDADLVGSNILSTANIFGVQGTVVVQNYYTGSSAPSSSLGSNGDLYLQA